MIKHVILVTILTTLWAGMAAGEEVLTIQVGGEDRIGYQARPMSNPLGGERFAGSNFIHPLQTPAGFTVTRIQPRHRHHFGLWWPWKYVETDGRRVLFWELQHGEGRVEAQESELTENGFTAFSVYRDFTAPDGAPDILIHERLNATVSDLVQAPAHGYFLDMEIIHENVTEAPLTITQHHYSGFAIRGTADWDRHTSIISTSEGEDRDSSNETPGRWVRIEGEADGDARAGLVMMSHPSNPRHPERLRTWNSGQSDGAVFVNFNPVQQESDRIDPGETFVRNYRVFVYDGTITDEEAEALWQTYSR